MLFTIKFCWGRNERAPAALGRSSAGGLPCPPAVASHELLVNQQKFKRNVIGILGFLAVFHMLLLLRGCSARQEASGESITDSPTYGLHIE